MMLEDLALALAVGNRNHRLKIDDSGVNNGVLHDELLIDVLCRLPARILMRCVCVCRGWYRLITDVCVPRVTPSLPLLGIDVRLRRRPRIFREKILYPSGSGSGSDSKIRIHLPVLPIEPQCNTFFIPAAADLLVDSCSGLELYVHHSKHRYILWNPTMRQYIPIPFPTVKPPAFAAVALHLGPSESVDIKIFAFPELEPKANEHNLHIHSLSAGKWGEHKVQYEHPVDAATLLDRCTYLNGKLFRLSYNGLLVWYTLKLKKDNINIVDVSYDYIELPNRGVGDRRKCIGSCMGRLRYAWTNFRLKLKIWVLSLDTREWIFRHYINLQALANNSQLVAFQAMSGVPLGFLPLAFDAHSDAIIVWTQNCIFSYRRNSGNPVLLRCGKHNDALLEESPLRAFPLTHCLVSLAMWGGKTPSFKCK
ncbi:hypothetical protein CCACVL1_16619 [Corchorus capsularis]|uniref:Uncharacterized protein n=1 Tax=Corchorus capsularis TaxID=210143 RepID=A0A1R3HW19_COCAP|nr:hypothetical protein CCACVL1_16619 [Corchorus capsularis]